MQFVKKISDVTAELEMKTRGGAAREIIGPDDISRWISSGFSAAGIIWISDEGSVRVRFPSKSPYEVKADRWLRGNLIVEIFVL